MGKQKVGFSPEKEKDFPSQTTRQLKNSLVAERSDSLQSIGQDPPEIAATVDSSLLDTKSNIPSLKNKSDSYADANGNNSKLKKISSKRRIKAQKRPKYGMEVILDLYDCDPKTIRSAKAIKSFAIKMCKVLKMKRFGKALTPHFGHNDPKTSGYSLLQFLETSSITGHFSEQWNSAYINIFSCKMFSAEKAISFTKKYFKSKKVVARKLIRK